VVEPATGEHATCLGFGRTIQQPKRKDVVAVRSGQVWATLPPVAVDGESWTLVWWYLGEQGLLCERSVSDGGNAIHDALSQGERLESQKLDVWHVWHVWHVASQVQGRCDRALQQLEDRLPIIQRQARYVAQATCYVVQELRSLLEVVVLRRAGVVGSRDRKLELETLLALLEEVREQALPTLQKEFVSLRKHLRLALPHLVLFAADLDEPQQQADERLGADRASQERRRELAEYPAASFGSASDALGWFVSSAGCLA